jgi:hypothetical protein
MSPFQGGGEGSRGNRRELSVNVDVNESSGSDWDSDSDNAEDGEVLVRVFCLDFFPDSCVLVFLKCFAVLSTSQPRYHWRAVSHPCRDRSKSAYCSCNAWQLAAVFRR